MRFIGFPGLIRLSAQLSFLIYLKSFGVQEDNISSVIGFPLQVLSILSVSFLAVEKISDISPLLFTGILEVNDI